MNCFNNLVGIRTECESQQPSDSNLYIQDLPLISIKLANSINTEHDNGIELLEQKRNLAIHSMLADVRAKLAPKFEQGSVLQNTTLGVYQDNKPLNNGVADFYKGYRIQTYASGNYTIFISSISIFTDHTGEIPLQVIDLTQGRVIDTIIINGIANEIVTVDVFKEYKTNNQYLNLFIGYNSTDINSYSALLYQNATCGSCRPATHSFKNDVVLANAMGLPVNGPLVQSGLVGLGEGGGLSITFSVNCSMDKWLCQIRNNFSLALLYKWGVEIIKEMKVTSRFNSLVTLKMDARDALLEDFELEYGKAMTDILNNLRLPNDKCFRCNSEVRTGRISI